MSDTNTEPALPSGNKRFFLNISQSDVIRYEMFIMGMIMGALLLATVQAYTGQGLPPSVQGNRPAGITGGDVQPTEGPIDTSQLTINENMAIGPADAPVTIFEYSDFQCPFCHRAFEATIPSILQYVAQGKVRFVYKNYAILGQESTWAAQAAECAADQGKFWKYHDELFRQAGIAGAENVGVFTKANLIRYANGLDLDLPKFRICLENDATLYRVENDLREGQTLQVAATPTFFINNTRLVGAQAWPTFADAINHALNPLH